MRAQYDSKIFSSFLLWLDNKITNKCQAYTNYSGNLYRISGQYQGYYHYGVPATQVVYDQSVNGANIITGVYLNNTFISTGQSGFLGFDYNKGHAIFNTNVSNYALSGYYAVKDVNIRLTADNEETILFKTKYYLKSKFPQTPTGVPPGYVEFPIIYVKDDGKSNTEFYLGGGEQTENNIRCVIIADSLFNLHNIQSVLVDSIRSPIALFESNEMPFNGIGALKSGVYNYTGIARVKLNEQNFVFIEDVRIPKQGQRVLLNDMINTLPKDVYVNFVDFTLTRVREPRNE